VVAAGLSLAAAIVGLRLPGRRSSETPAPPAEEPVRYAESQTVHP
jgi:hypothetical protein